MPSEDGLHGYFSGALARHPDNVAVVEPGHGSVTYARLDQMSNRVRDRLHALGVRPGDRVGIYLRKSIDSVAAIYGILKAGAAYVPVDPGAPAERNAYIMANCAVKAVFVESGPAGDFRIELARQGAAPALLVTDTPGAGQGLLAALARADELSSAAPVDSVSVVGSDLAYILYTSGSTGKPKGVMLSHENAVTFVDWCSEVFEPQTADRFSSHAPFHFDLSVLDIHVCFKHGATLVLVNEEIGKDPVRLARLIADEGISIWYSAPSILSLLAQFGDLAAHDYSSLRHILFAGEVFPVKHLRTLCELLPGDATSISTVPPRRTSARTTKCPDPSRPTGPFPTPSAGRARTYARGS